MIKRYLLLTILFFGLTVDIHFYGSGIKQEFTFENSVMLVLSWLALLSFFTLIEATGRKSLTAVAAAIVAFLFYFTKRIGYHLGYNLINNNADYLKSFAGLRQIYDLLHEMFIAADFINSLVFAILMYATFTLKPSSRDDFFKKKYSILISFFILMVCSVFMPYSHDPVTVMIRSVYRNFVPRNNAIAERARNLLFLPAIPIQSSFPPSKSRPHIFLIIVESFNSRFINQKTSNGQEYTPFFNKLTKDHLYLENYFSNSVYTSKSQFSAICGQIPMIKKTEFRNSECFKFECTPELIRKTGYETFYAQADPNFSTDQTQKFMLTHGFKHFLPLVKNCLEETEKCYGIGIRDSSFFKRVFKHMQDPVFKNDIAEKPFFMTLSTVSSHMPFTYLEGADQKFFKNPKDRREHYLNFLSIIDEGIQQFFSELEKSPYADNSIVITESSR